MTREEQTALILKNGFQYKGKQTIWFKIHGYNEGEKRGLKVVVDSVSCDFATRIMFDIFCREKRKHPKNELKIDFADIYDKELMEGL